jgi:hypothetical protein
MHTAMRARALPCHDGGQETEPRDGHGRPIDSRRHRSLLDPRLTRYRVAMVVCFFGEDGAVVTCVMETGVEECECKRGE